MNRVLWLRGQKNSDGRFDTGERDINKTEVQARAAVFIALPRKNNNNTQVLPAAKAPAGVFVLLPQKPCLLNGNADAAQLKRKSLFSAATLAFLCFIAVIFVAIGMLNLMIRSFRLQPFAQGNVVLEQASHKPGAGPSPQDAVLNEYQHALTREMVAVADTTLFVAADKKLAGKGILEQITFSEEAPDVSTVPSSAQRKVKIYNGTAKTLDRVVVQIDVLNKEGHLLRTEYHTARRIASLDTKTIELDQPAPDAQLRCYVQDLKSKSLRTSLRSL